MSSFGERPLISPEIDALAKIIVDAFFKVHIALGPGLLESAYVACVAHELRSRGINVRLEVELPIVYGGMKLDVGYRLDMLVEDLIIVEFKSVEKLLPIHRAQMITYLKLSEKRLGFLVNFNVEKIRDGIERIAY